MRIGIVGAENSHTAAIAQTLNIDKAVRGFTVTHVWGETPEFAAKAAEAGQIPNCVKKYTDMIGEVDAILVDQRHGKEHLPSARPFVEAKLPVFVDKPFCTDLAKGIEFVEFAKQQRVPITSYSVLSLQQSALDFAKAMQKLGTVRSLVTTGPVDLESKWGGVFFYGIHQVDLICSLLDAAPVRVATLRQGDNGVATVAFDSGAFAVVHCLKGHSGFHATAYGSEGAHDANLPFDAKPYLAGVKRFCKMFQTKTEPVSPVSYLRPVAILQAMQKSFKTGKPVEVAEVPEL